MRVIKLYRKPNKPEFYALIKTGCVAFLGTITRQCSTTLTTLTMLHLSKTSILSHLGGKMTFRFNEKD